MSGTRKSRECIENLEFRFGSSSSQTSQNSGDFCRICHESDNVSPLLTPCRCSGSLRYVHEMCLIQWLTASETNSCELCKFPFIMQSKIKPFNEWRSLDISGVERRRLFCAVLFHLAAALCVIWSLCVLIERSAEEVRSDKLGWPFWTKLVVVTVGLTGGIVFMYIQCKQYLNLCSRWRARNRILLISNAPEKVPKNITHSPVTLTRSQHSSNITLNRNNSSILVITAPLNIGSNMDQSDHVRFQGQLHQQQSQIIANIENNSVNFELDDDEYSQISFKQHLRHEEGNSSRGSLHNVYDNMSISTTNTSATTRNFHIGDTDSNFLKTIPGLQEEQETDGDEKKLSQHADKARTSMFVENSDILNDQNYPKLYFRHSTILLPTTAKNSRSSDDDSFRKLQMEKRRYSDTKLLNSIHFENEFLVKPSDEQVLGSPIKGIYDVLEQNIQNILEMDIKDIKDEDEFKEEHLPLRNEADKKEKRNIFKSLPNLDTLMTT